MLQHDCRIWTDINLYYAFLLVSELTADQLLTGNSRDHSQWSEDSECSQSFHVKATSFFSNWSLHSTDVVYGIHDHSEQAGEKQKIWYWLSKWLFRTNTVSIIDHISGWIKPFRPLSYKLRGLHTIVSTYPTDTQTKSKMFQQFLKYASAWKRNP